MNDSVIKEFNGINLFLTHVLLFLLNSTCHSFMVRIARVVAPGFPHHISQRGNRRHETFFNDADYQAYIDLVSEFHRVI